ncbi:FixH family protein [Ornithinimicrobium cryptoxanthini]|uniref:FixH family protein n=1 Tax=Ornithinimicrobium cryptoxanthini TaxID=2934161 RepID=A0ABY4YI30_9MICO|nr:FixH family protein [Ornithinimicrobium cryptoxanthini]USQ76453.1 FixH family protein [Ornithinimicrobium cryptoxanthini]
MQGAVFSPSAWAWAALLVLLLAPMSTGVAFAHDDEGVLELVEARSADGSVELRVELRYSGDGHPATDATVTVAGDGPAGAVLQPVVLEPTDVPGVYGAEVDLPDTGEWTLRFSSLGPIAALAHTEVVDRGAPDEADDATDATAPPLETAETPTPSPGAGPEEPSATGPETEAPAGLPDDTTTQVPSTAGTNTAEPGGTPTTLLVAGGVIVLLVLGTLAVLWGRRQKGQPGSGTT